MNNIYVDELPDCCGNCSLCCKDDLGYWCQATILIYVDERFVAEKRLKSCPLKRIADRLAEERKKVVQEIRERLTKYTLTNDDFLFDTYYKSVDVEKVLEKVERGE